MEFTFTWRELLVAVILATLVYLLESAWSARRKRWVKGDEADAELPRLRAELAALQQRLDELEARLGGDGAPVAASANAAYDYAVQYARQGMIAPEIAARCGISRDEAALIVAMHRPGQEA